MRGIRGIIWKGEQNWERAQGRADDIAIILGGETPLWTGNITKMRECATTKENKTLKGNKEDSATDSYRNMEVSMQS